ncbi:hypothetical protein BB560_005661, partial [Smittium megazygosporum]
MNNELQQVETLSTAFKQMGIGNTSFQANEAPQERIYANENEYYKYGTWEINQEHHIWISRHNYKQKLAPQSVTEIKTRHPIPAGGYFKSLEINKTIRPSQQAAKEDRQLAEAEQQILDLGRIAIHIEELARGLEGIQNPSEPEVKGFAQEITGSAQDLLILAFNYSSKIKHARRTAIATTSGHDRDTATSAPESEFTETQYLFHTEVLSRVEEHRSKSRNDKLLESPYQGKSETDSKDLETNHTKITEAVISEEAMQIEVGTVEEPTNTISHAGPPHTKTISNVKGPSRAPVKAASPIIRRGFKMAPGKIRKSKNRETPNLENRLRDIRKSVPNDTVDDQKTRKNIWVPRDTHGTPGGTHAKPPKEEARLLAKARQKHVGRHYFEEWVSDTTYPVTPTHARKGIPPGSSPLGSHMHNGALKDPPTTGYDAYQRVCSQRRIQNGGCEVPEGLDPSIRLYIQAGCKVSLSPHSPPSIFLEDVPIYLSKHNIRIPMSSIWADNSTQNLLQDDEGCYRASQSNGDTSSVLHRRHCDTWEDRGGVSQTHSNYLESPPESGILYKCREIYNSSQYQPNILRIHVRHSQHDNPFNKGQAQKDPQRSEEGNQSLTYDTAGNGTEWALHNYRYNALCKVSRDTIEDLQWWNTQLDSWNISPLMLKPADPNAPVSATTDASGTGWGITSDI